MTSLGHGWQYYVDEIDELCSQGEFLIASGIMFWADEHKKKVVTVVAHVGLDVTWENRYVNPEGKGILCKHCEDGGHSVAG
ncbi:hypothetical protein QQX98_009097 [Neonectria punicea]|uniref:Uncharacterized protein n=1 Tax=Neonectria punicea TaxID=979145 RepID=A0ABR1GTF1_9HYPO